MNVGDSVVCYNLKQNINQLATAIEKAVKLLIFFFYVCELSINDEERKMKISQGFRCELVAHRSCRLCGPQIVRKRFWN